MARNDDEKATLPSGATHEMLTEGNGGWVRYQSDVLTNPVFVRVDDSEGRLVLVDLYMPAAEGAGIDTAALRQIPTGRIEAWVNDPGVAASVRSKLKIPAPDLRTAISYFATTFGSRRPTNWVTRMFDAQDPHTDEPKPKPGAPLAAPLIDPVFYTGAPTLKIPEGRSYGDDFYRQVAALYGHLARRTANPVTTIAKHHDVPLSTVQRWVREARIRGYLPAARPGKRG